MRISDWSSDVCSSDLTLEAVLSAVESANSARGWAPSVIRYELLLLAQLGFALDLTHCAGGGDAGDLAYVSPKSSIAVSRAMGAPYAERLLHLPGFLTGGAAAPGGEPLAEGIRLRSEERSVGNEFCRTCSSRRLLHHLTKKKPV